MKKLMIAAAAIAAVATAGAVESANIVGYDTLALRGGNQAKGVGASFIPVSEGGLKLGDIKIIGYDTTEGYADFEVQAKQLDGYGRGGTAYYWCDFEEEGDVYYGWYDEDMNEYNDLALVAGEGLWVYSPSTDFQIQSAGAVPDTNIAVTLRGGNQAKLVVNPMPTTVTLGDVTVAGYNTTDGYADFEIQAKQLDGYGRGGTAYYWCDFEEEGDVYYGWYDEDMNEYNDLEVVAGDGLWIYSPSTAYSVVFPTPLAD